MRLAFALLLLGTIAFAQGPSLGERIYKGKCANCHSVDGSAGSPLGRRLKMRDLRSEEVQALSDSQLSAVINKGRGNMPGFQQQFKGEQLPELLRYLRSLRQVKSATAQSTAE